MKKSRIIIPALAMIAFSVAASISGAVAWFTASRTAAIDAGEYAVVKTSSNLSVALDDTNAVGAAIDTDEGTTHIMDITGVLSDASFNHVESDGTIYAPNETGRKVGKKTALADADATELLRGVTENSENIYSAILWDISFTVKFGSASGNIGLFLDLSQSSFTASNETVETGDYDTAKGFRMAFVPQNGGELRVFADLQAAAKCSYVGATALNADLPAGTSYSSPTLIDSSDDSALEGSYAASAVSTMPNYFGTFTFDAGQEVSLDYTVVCWFEGTDENIVDATTEHDVIFRSVTAALAFEAITLA